MQIYSYILMAFRTYILIYMHISYSVECCLPLEVAGGNENLLSSDQAWIMIDPDLGPGAVWHANKTRRFME